MPNISTICVHCGTPFEGRPDRLYCAPKCRKAAYRLRERARILESRRHRETLLLELAKREGRRLAMNLHRGRLMRIDEELQVIASPQSSAKVSRITADSTAGNGQSEGQDSHTEMTQ